MALIHGDVQGGATEKRPRWVLRKGANKGDERWVPRVPLASDVERGSGGACAYTAGTRTPVSMALAQGTGVVAGWASSAGFTSH